MDPYFFIYLRSSFTMLKAGSALFRMKKRQILATSLGNTLEWFDFALFIFLAPIIGEKFFPTHNPTTATLAALSVFAAGFICRPLGGILFGHAGDTHGRANALRMSILVITVSTLLIGILPTYQQVGVIASILFTMLRLAQGISIGGEYSGVMIYLAESAPSKKRGFITSFAALGANIGFLAANLLLMLLSAIFSKAAWSDWGWRLPFFLIGLPGTLILYYRFKLAETPIFLNLKKTHHIQKSPFLTSLRQAPNQLFKILGLTCMSSTLYYVFFGYMTIYLTQFLGVKSHVALNIQSAFLVIMLFLVPLFGHLGDRVGRKSMLIFTALGTILLAIPCFYFLKFKTIPMIAFALSIATVLSSSDQGNSLAAVVENCSANIRYSGIAFSYNLGMALFGGTAPFVVTLLTEKVNLFAPAFYLMGMAGITLIAATHLLRKANINAYL